MRITIEKWFKDHRISISKDNFVMCVDNGYKPHFKKGEIYKVKCNGVAGNKIFSIESSKYNIMRMDDKVINKIFIPLQGDPDNLTLRDKLMIRIRNGK